MVAPSRPLQSSQSPGFRDQGKKGTVRHSIILDVESALEALQAEDWFEFDWLCRETSASACRSSISSSSYSATFHSHTPNCMSTSSHGCSDRPPSPSSLVGS